MKTVTLTGQEPATNIQNEIGGRETGEAVGDAVIEAVVEDGRPNCRSAAVAVGRCRASRGECNRRVVRMRVPSC
jgi:hypothetical protein